MSTLLTVENLKTQFKTDFGLVTAVNDVSYVINEKEIVGIVGESGCGKSVSQLSVMQLIASPPGRIAGGKVIFDGKDLLKFKANSPEMRAIRGAKIAMIFQEPMTSLNPVLTIGDQIGETLQIHFGVRKNEAQTRAVELLKMVGIPAAESRVNDYPHQFSGGMRQRVMIAMGISCSPRLLIADEPTTALDVTTQEQLLELIKGIVEQFNVSMVLVTHNLGVVARYAQRIYVMYAGRIVESGTTKELFGNPRHPYTMGLLKCLPRLDETGDERLVPIVGMPPNLIDMAETCAFLPRCTYSTDQCLHSPWPELRLINGQHFVRCYAEVFKK
jgi:peptide/nickel transport system ATP-binding protein